MPLTLVQTDTPATCGTSQGCSGGTTPITPQARQATAGGTAGTTPLTVTIPDNVPPSPSDHGGVMFQSAVGEPGLVNWASGDWVVRLNVTSTNANLTWVATYICRFSSGCASLSTIGSLTGQSTSLGSSGVKTHTVSGSAATANATDTIYIVLLFSNPTGSNQSFGFTPNQNIDTPLSDVSDFSNAWSGQQICRPTPRLPVREGQYGHINAAFFLDDPNASLANPVSWEGYYRHNLGHRRAGHVPLARAAYAQDFADGGGAFFLETPMSGLPAELCWKGFDDPLNAHRRMPRDPGRLAPYAQDFADGGGAFWLNDPFATLPSPLAWEGFYLTVVGHRRSGHHPRFRHPYALHLVDAGPGFFIDDPGASITALSWRFCADDNPARYWSQRPFRPDPPAYADPTVEMVMGDVPITAAEFAFAAQLPDRLARRPDRWHPLGATDIRPFPYSEDVDAVITAAVQVPTWFRAPWLPLRNRYRVDPFDFRTFPHFEDFDIAQVAAEQQVPAIRYSRNWQQNSWRTEGFSQVFSQNDPLADFLSQSHWRVPFPDPRFTRPRRYGGTDDADLNPPTVAVWLGESLYNLPPSWWKPRTLPHAVLTPISWPETIPDNVQVIGQWRGQDPGPTMRAYQRREPEGLLPPLPFVIDVPAGEAWHVPWQKRLAGSWRPPRPVGRHDGPTTLPDAAEAISDAWHVPWQMPGTLAFRPKQIEHQNRFRNVWFAVDTFPESSIAWYVVPEVVRGRWTRIRRWQPYWEEERSVPEPGTDQTIAWAVQPTQPAFPRGRPASWWRELLRYGVVGGPYYVTAAELFCHGAIDGYILSDDAVQTPAEVLIRYYHAWQRWHRYWLQASIQDANNTSSPWASKLPLP